MAASLAAPGVNVVEVDDPASLAEALAAARAAGGVHVVVARVASRLLEAGQIRQITESLKGRSTSE